MDYMQKYHSFVIACTYSVWNLSAWISSEINQLPESFLADKSKTLNPEGRKILFPPSLFPGGCKLESIAVSEDENVLEMIKKYNGEIGKMRRACGDGEDERRHPPN